MDIIDTPAAECGDLQPTRSREACQVLGLECDECVQNAAKNLAEICPSASPAAVQKLFNVLYPDACCAALAFAFIRAYRAANRLRRNVAFHAA